MKIYKLEDILPIYEIVNDKTTKPINLKEKLIFTEGKEISLLQNLNERSRAARDACIKIHGCTCFVCGFNFEKTYGDIGKDFIHVHHKTHLSNFEEVHEVDPENDLIPVCPNCHAMLHTKVNGDYISVEQLKKYPI